MRKKTLWESKNFPRSQWSLKLPDKPPFKDAVPEIEWGVGEGGPASLTQRVCDWWRLPRRITEHFKKGSLRIFEVRHLSHPEFEYGATAVVNIEDRKISDGVFCVGGNGGIPILVRLKVNPKKSRSRIGYCIGRKVHDVPRSRISMIGRVVAHMSH